MNEYGGLEDLEWPGIILRGEKLASNMPVIQPLCPLDIQITSKLWTHSFLHSVRAVNFRARSTVELGYNVMKGTEYFVL
jgi:hypothetical protein